MKYLNSFVGNKLAYYRQQSCLTQQAVADELKLSRPSIINMEKGRHPVALKHLFALACLYEQEISVFFPTLQFIKKELGLC